ITLRRTPPPRGHLQTLQLSGMAHALVEQLQRAAIAALSFEARCGRLVDRARTERATRRLTTRWRQAQLRQTAGSEALASRHPRGLATSLMTRLAPCQWGREPHRVCIAGPTGMGPTCFARA